MNKYIVEYVDNARYTYHLIVWSDTIELAESKAIRFLNGCRLISIQELP